MDVKREMMRMINRTHSVQQNGCDKRVGIGRASVTEGERLSTNKSNFGIESTTSSKQFTFNQHKS